MKPVPALPPKSVFPVPPIPIETCKEDIANQIWATMMTAFRKQPYPATTPVPLVTLQAESGASPVSLEGSLALLPNANVRKDTMTNKTYQPVKSVTTPVRLAKVLRLMTVPTLQAVPKVGGSAPVPVY